MRSNAFFVYFFVICCCFLLLFLCYFSYLLLSHILWTSKLHNTAPLANKGNYVYSQSSGAGDIKHIYTSAVYIWHVRMRGLNSNASSCSIIISILIWGKICSYQSYLYKLYSCLFQLSGRWLTKPPTVCLEWWYARQGSDSDCEFYNK